MDRKQAKKRIRAVKKAVRNAKGIEKIVLENELEVLTYIIERG